MVWKHHRACLKFGLHACLLCSRTRMGVWLPSKIAFTWKERNLFHPPLPDLSSSECTPTQNKAWQQPNILHLIAKEQSRKNECCTDRRLPVPIDQSMVILRASNKTSSEPLWRIAISFAPVKCRHAAPSPPTAIREQILRWNSNSNNKHWLRKFKEVVIVSSLWPTSMFIFSRIISGKHVRYSKYDFTVESIGQANPLPGDSATVKQGEGEATSGCRGHLSFRYYVYLTETNLPKSRGQTSY